MTSPTVTLGALNHEADDPGALAAFYAAVVGAPAPAPQEGAVFVPAAGPDGFALFFHQRSGPRPVRNGVHLDLTVPWGDRRDEVDRIVELGARWRWDVLDEHPHVRWTTLADPEGTLFCVAEHPPASA